MTKHEINIIVVAIVVLAVSIAGLIMREQGNKNSLSSNATDRDYPQSTSPYRLNRTDITPNATYSALMEETGIARPDADKIFAAAKNIYDLSQIRAGRTLDLYFNKKSSELEKLVYQIDSEEELTVTKVASAAEVAKEIEIASVENPWQAQRVSIDYEIKIRKVKGVLQTSLYKWALANQIDERAIIEFANALQWSIDFANDPQVGDRFAFIFEERYRDGVYVMPSTIFAGKYLNVDKEHLAFYFEENEKNQGYFDAQGNSLQKMFLRAPVAYKYISSGFTTGLRYVQAFNVSTGHRAIDYAAAYGTPIQSVGNGTVTRAGWNGSYGNFISVRHNGTYTTNYAHLSRIAVRAGQSVSQGQVIGYVGSTGFSTGPHLHYEMEKHGAKINPLKEVLPPGKPIAQENKDKFFKEIKPYLKELE
ncbi:M23 family metallopeptidase [Candidatus Uhrbacteria bacterium]|nr:M23 family metallopeptidase [Candidatus Uhrbacteria bacterium]